MYLRKVRSAKAGKTYWQLVESYRDGKCVRQRTVASLGALDDDEREGWMDFVHKLNRDPEPAPDMFAEPRVDPSVPVNVRPGAVRVERSRDFGDAWLGLSLWRMLGFGDFLRTRLVQGREEVAWSDAVAFSVVARFCESSSELAMAESFADRSALCDLLQIDPARINDDRLYRTLDCLLAQRGAMLEHLKERYTALFDCQHDLLLYDLTSTYFTGAAARINSARRGYSRDGHPEAKQIVVALVLTREGLPLACEVFAGNRHDAKTLRAIVRLMRWRYGAVQRIWVMDRGIASEENLAWLRAQGADYLVGTPRPMLRRFEQQMLAAKWRTVRSGLDVSFVAPPQDDEPGPQETFILCKSDDRRQKELAIIERFAGQLEEGLRALQARCRASKRPLRDKLALGKRLGVLLKTCSRASSLFTIEVVEDSGALDLKFERKKATGDTWAEKSAGHYLLRSNIKSSTMTPEELWETYIGLTEVEAAFRCLKTDLGLRPIHHQREDRVKAHVFVCFLALCLRRSLKLSMERWHMGSSIEKVIAELRAWRQVDVILPTTDGREIRRRIVETPSPTLRILLRKLAVRPPKMLNPADASPPSEEGSKTASQRPTCSVKNEL